MAYKIRVERDDCYESPRDWDNIGTMACFHSRYILGDKDHGYSREEVKEIYASDEYVSLPLYLYDHSGITMNTTGFSCPWDSCQVGIIFVSKKLACKELGIELESFDNRDLERVIKVLRSEVETYDMYLRGDVWGYIIEQEVEYTNADTGKTITVPEEVESCWGFYGYEYCEAEAKAIVESMEARVA